MDANSDLWTTVFLKNRLKTRRASIRKSAKSTHTIFATCELDLRTSDPKNKWVSANYPETFLCQVW